MTDLTQPLLQGSNGEGPTVKPYRPPDLQAARNPAAEHPETSTGEDFDFCFWFHMPGLAASYTKSLSPAAKAAESQSPEITEQLKRRQQRLDEAADQAQKENEWFHDELKEWAHREEADQMKGAAKPKKLRTMNLSGEVEVPSEWIRDIFEAFIHESRDRQELDLSGGPSSLDDARTLAIDLISNFFRREKEPYHTFMFVSLDRDEVFLCVKMLERTAITHAEDSRYNMQISNEAIATLNIKLEAGPKNPAFLPYCPFLHDADLLMKKKNENNPEVESVISKTDAIHLLYDRVTDVLDVDAMKRWKLVVDYFPLHSRPALWELCTKWAKMSWFYRFDQPIDAVHSYFGSQITLYFVFLGLLCQWMVYLIAGAFVVTVGVFFQCRSLHETVHGFLLGSKFNDARIALAIITIVWIQLFIARLKQRINQFLNLWGDDVVDQSTVKKRENPRFLGTAGPSEVDENMITYQAPLKDRARGRMKSFLFTFAFICFTIFCVAGIFVFGAHLETAGHSWAFSAAGYAVSLQIKVFNKIWEPLSLALIDMEHHQFVDSFNDSRGSKSFSFQFINAFASFFYVAFAMKWLEACPADYPDGCWGYLCHEMVIVFLIYIASTAYDIVLPIWTIKQKIKKEKLEAANLGIELGQLSFLEQQSKMEEYDGAAQTEDFCQIIMPLAFVLMFGITLPLCSVLALVCFGLQLRADAFKLTRAQRRPFPARSHIDRAGGGLGVWMVILEVLGYMAVFTNVALIVFSLEPFNSFRLDDQLLLFFAFCILTVVVKLVMSSILPEVTDDIYLARQRHERQREVIYSCSHHFHHSNPDAPVRKFEEVLAEVEAQIDPVKFRASHKLDVHALECLVKEHKFWREPILKK
mmetsp:Transcript_47728/g.101934  ORF Transcript_47728/g.101934 Transcript_47728/m.101934 type:complete len:867 (+) Transcript_47728:40-2640(+)